ncbi:MAG: two-component system nitrogen regulation sensor histidine kinase NtrY [Halieaceae bacterium]|jgi:two-component system nitrogen regulation sensor histidine kinase NtrY
MGFNRFSALLALRLAVIMALLIALGYFFSAPGFHAATLLSLGLVAMLGYEVVHFVSRTNQEISRFLDAARYADFGQRFNLGSMGAGFEDLGATFSDILEKFREQRTGQESELRHLNALLEHVPVPLISVHADGRVTLWNNTSRRLFGVSHIGDVNDMALYGEAFSKILKELPPGERQLADFAVDGMERRLTVAVSEIVLEGEPERLISLQDIQSELDGMQLDAWQDLVRVLTHEIMNSITPVASLAKTTVDLVDDAAAKVTDHPDVVEDLVDVKNAVATVARRSDSLMKFVSSYRRLTHLPAPEKSSFRLSALFETVARLAANDWEAKGISLHMDVEPAQLELDGDRGMIEQVLINMLQNAAQALQSHADGAISLRARFNKRGHVIIEITDNGPGIPKEIQQKIFVPFFTTRRDGSGVGLALSRQIMIAHGGSITVRNEEPRGARFTLTF